jgi:hypothetical protein
MEIFETIAASSQLHITWALTLIGGTVVTIVGTSHVSPKTPKTRLIYLFFIPSWFFLTISIWFGDLVSRNHLAALLVEKSAQREILQEINTNYYYQQQTILFGTICLSVWLVLYLIWWIFIRQDTKGED